MRTIRRGPRIPAVTLAPAMVIGLGGCTSDDATSTPGATALSGTIVVSAASASGLSDAAAAVEISITIGVGDSPDRVESIPLGSAVRLSILDPSAVQEYHVSGYELGTGVETAVGVPGVFQCTADTAGDFVIESHPAGVALLTLKVD